MCTRVQWAVHLPGALLSEATFASLYGMAHALPPQHGPNLRPSNIPLHILPADRGMATLLLVILVEVFGYVPFSYADF